ncbi:MAG: hypothetical protein CVV49_10285 [Spirochaetae bacterium HGW-Spirochaetae-5]|nr:MAG: hypothetical protein CVV49_10285 [Spirochaetae bacterium HGW-Spirochaetae-5]
MYPLLSSPQNPPDGDFKDICFNKYLKMNEFCDTASKSPSGRCAEPVEVGFWGWAFGAAK